MHGCNVDENDFFCNVPELNQKKAVQRTFVLLSPCWMPSWSKCQMHMQFLRSTPELNTFLDSILDDEAQHILFPCLFDPLPANQLDNSWSAVSDPANTARACRSHRAFHWWSSSCQYLPSYEGQHVALWISVCSFWQRHWKSNECYGGRCQL